MKLPLAATLLACSLTATAGTYGPLANFDVINDTGQVAHGFEIEIDGIQQSDISSLFGAANRWPGMERYGAPVVSTTATGVRVTYKDLTKSTPSGTLPVSPRDSCWPLGAPGPNGYGPNYPCDHFGVSTYVPTPVVRYHWLVEPTPGNMNVVPVEATVPNVQINIAPQPAAVIQPPAAAIHAVMAAPAPNAYEFGEPRWVKVTATGFMNNIAVEDLMGNNALMQNAQTQIEWQRLQYDANATGGGANGTIDLTGVALDPGAVGIAYRFEYYAYNGAFDPQTHEAITGVDTSGSPTPPATVGKYLGAQMVGVNFDGVIPPAPPLPIAPTINASIAGGIVGQTYSSTFDVTPVVAADTLEVIITGLPDGLTYATVGSKVTISGAPTVVGSFPLTITANDLTNQTSISASTAIDIADSAMAFSVAFNPATVGSPYVYPFSVLGGYGTKTYSTVSAIPAGLSIINDTLAGTPTVEGTFPIIMSVKDSLGFTQNAASSSLVVSKAPVVVPPVVPVPVACTGNNGIMSSATATTAEIGGGVANNGITVDLPATVSFTAPLTAADAFAANNLLTYAGTVNAATKHCVADVAAIALGLSVYLPNPYSSPAGVEYSPSAANLAAGGLPIQVSVTGGVGPYTVIASGLPLGMSLDATNTLVGIPAVAGTYTVSISVNDNNGQSSNSTITLVIDPAPVAQACSGTDEKILGVTGRLTPMVAFDGTLIKAAYVGTPTTNVATPQAGVTYSYLQGLANGSFPVGGLISYTGTYGQAQGGLNGTPLWCIPTTVTVKPVPVVCTTPQVRDAATNTCVTPVPVCVSPQVLNAATNSCVTPAPAPLTCTVPAGAKAAPDIHAKLTAVNGKQLTIGSKAVTLLDCAKITYKGKAKAPVVGYDADANKGYILNGITYTTSIIIDDGK
jgi:hypothetical protein